MPLDTSNSRRNVYLISRSRRDVYLIRRSTLLEQNIYIYNNFITVGSIMLGFAENIHIPFYCVCASIDVFPSFTSKVREDTSFACTQIFW